MRKGKEGGIGAGGRQRKGRGKGRCKIFASWGINTTGRQEEDVGSRTEVGEQGMEKRGALQREKEDKTKKTKRIRSKKAMQENKEDKGEEDKRTGIRHRGR